MKRTTRPARRTSKAYAVARARLSGVDFHLATYRRLLAGYPTPELAHEDNVYRRSHRVVSRSRHIMARPGRYFYCQHCGARVTASQSVVIAYDPNPTAPYVSCGAHGEILADTTTRRLRPGDFYR